MRPDLQFTVAGGRETTSPWDRRGRGGRGLEEDRPDRRTQGRLPPRTSYSPEPASLKNYFPNQRRHLLCFRSTSSAFRWAQRIRSYHIRKGESVEQCLACHSYMCSAWRSGLSYSHVRLLQRSSKPIKISRLWIPSKYGCIPKLDYKVNA